MKANEDTSGGIPSTIVEMMKARGYTGSGKVGYYEAMKWLYEKYNAWLVATPRYLTPIQHSASYSDGIVYDNLMQMWQIDSRNVTSCMPGEHYCSYFAIHHENNPVYQSIEDADVYGHEVCEESGKFYMTYEDAICAGLIRTMLWLSD